MARYIEVELLKDEIMGARVIQKPQFLNTEETLMVIDNQPTADVEEVRHGHWLNIGFGEYWCSVCDTNGEDVLNKRGLPHWKRCPNCGTKMDGGKTE